MTQHETVNSDFPSFSLSSSLADLHFPPTAVHVRGRGVGPAAADGPSGGGGAREGGGPVHRPVGFPGAETAITEGQLCAIQPRLFVRTSEHCCFELKELGAPRSIHFPTQRTHAMICLLLASKLCLGDVVEWRGERNATPVMPAKAPTPLGS